MVQDWSIKCCGMCCPVCGKEHLKKYVTMTIYAWCPIADDMKIDVLDVSLNKTNFPFYKYRRLADMQVNIYTDRRNAMLCAKHKACDQGREPSGQKLNKRRGGSKPKLLWLSPTRFSFEFQNNRIWTMQYTSNSVLCFLRLRFLEISRRIGRWTNYSLGNKRKGIKLWKLIVVLQLGCFQNCQRVHRRQL